jgi:hypothetical protein
MALENKNWSSGPTQDRRPRETSQSYFNKRTEIKKILKGVLQLEGKLPPDESPEKHVS